MSEDLFPDEPVSIRHKKIDALLDLALKNLQEVQNQSHEGLEITEWSSIPYLSDHVEFISRQIQQLKKHLVETVQTSV